MALAPADRSKLVRVLGLLGSPHQGEVVAAAAAADRLVRGRGLDWADVLASSSPGHAANFTASRRHDAYQPSPVPDHVGDLQACGQRLDLLMAWEQEFVANLATHRSLSRRQREILAEIAAKVRSAGPRAG